MESTFAIFTNKKIEIENIKIAERKLEQWKKGILFSAENDELKAIDCNDHIDCPEDCVQEIANIWEAKRKDLRKSLRKKGFRISRFTTIKIIDNLYDGKRILQRIAAYKEVEIED